MEVLRLPSAPRPVWPTRHAAWRPALTRGVTALLVLLAPVAAAMPASAEGSLLPGTGDELLPDLVVVDIAWSPAQPEPGQSVTFTATVKNQGNASAGNSTLRFTLDGNVSLGDRAVGNLTPGAAANVTSDAWNATQGNHTIEALADALGQVTESNEANNERSESFNVATPGQPDLVVVDIAWSPASPVEGQDVTFTASVKNRGNASAGNSTLRFTLEGNVSLGDRVVGNLAPGATVNVTSDSWNATQGNHTIEALADALGQVQEGNETNNERSESFSVSQAPKPDLVVLDIAWSPASPVEGDNVTFKATIKNQGNAGAGNFTVRFLLDGSQLAPDVSVAGLAAGATANVTSAAWTATQGNHTVKAMADALGQVREGNESNNEREESFQVFPAARPDLVVDDIALSPDLVLPGTNATFKAKVRNQGDAGAGSFRVRFVLDGAQSLGDHLVEGLGAGQSVLVGSDPWSATLGNHTIQTLADVLDEAAESQEGNNARTESFSVPALLVLEILPTGGSVSAGDRLPAVMEVAPRPLVPTDASTAATAGLSLAAVLAALYHRIHGQDALRAPNRLRAYEAVRRDPGCTVGSVARALGVSYKTAQRHVRTLRRAGYLSVLSGPQARLFVTGALPPGQQQAAAALRGPSVRRLWERLQQGPAGPRRLARELGIAPSTVAALVRRLDAAGLVTRLPGGRVAARPHRGSRRS